MDEITLRNLLQRVQHSEISVDAALESLRDLPFEDLGFVKLDHHRSLRKGFPEVILAQGKTPAQVTQIFRRLVEHGGPVLATRASPAISAAVQAEIPTAVYNELGRTLAYTPDPLPLRSGTIMILSAGTADLPVAEEAAETAAIMGNRVERIYDVGVAGIHRLFAHLKEIHSASVIIVVAGMEGALPSVVGGLVDRPIIAVPTSVGYGASFGGIAALLGMLNTCAPGVTVVNIDNGFGAAYAASLINRQIDSRVESEPKHARLHNS